MMLLKDFSEEVILEMCRERYGWDGLVRYLSGRIVDTSRWSYLEEHLLSYRGETYSVMFDVAATEMQECDQEIRVSKVSLADLVSRVEAFAKELGLNIRTLELQEKSCQ